MKCPCEFCTGKRHPGCHGKCDAYIIWKEEHDSKSADRRKEIELGSQTHEIRQNRFRRSKVKKWREL